MSQRHIDALDWPAKSLYHNVIERVWGVIACKVHARGRRLTSVCDSQDAITEAWNGNDTDYLQRLYHTIPWRLIFVV